MFSSITQHTLQDLPIGDGGLQYAQHFLSLEQADRLFAELVTQVPWQQAEIRLFGKSVMTPRLSCWMGDASAVYRYSNTTFLPEAWLNSILALKNQLETAVGCTFNSVLLNYYRNGQDAMGWHSDDEPELGTQPAIASVSLGAERRFLLREKTKNARSMCLPLANGSLLLMQGDSQKLFQHALPRTAKPIGARINLTFRKIL